MPSESFQTPTSPFPFLPLKYHRLPPACGLDTACENPSPGCLSRAQFVPTLSGALESFDLAALHRLYSSFDPDGTDRVRYVDVLACLVVTHKPDTQAFLERLQQTFLGNLR